MPDQHSYDIGATDIIIKRKYLILYEKKIQSNKVKYSTATGPYSTTHDVMMPFCMSEFSSSNILLYRFHSDNDEGELGIDYDTIIGIDLVL